MDPINNNNHHILQPTKLKVVRNLFDAKPQGNYDRFIPCRSNNNWETTFATMSSRSDLNNTRTSSSSSASSTTVKKPNNRDNLNENNRDSSIYNILLRNEILGEKIEDIKSSNQCDDRQALTPIKTRNLFRYGTPIKKNQHNERIPMKCQSSPYSLSPLSASSQRLLRSPHKATRKISRIPFKVLDAPELQDDFYLNLVDWSVQNVLSVGLGSCVYLWSACTSQVSKLCDLSNDGNLITSVSWSERGNLVAVGTNHGYVTVWDAAVGKEVNKLLGHSARVGALAWNGDVLSSGSRDRMILQRDTRISPSIATRRLIGHRQEVCGLKWSPDNQYLASGGNDNRLYVWNMQSLSPVQTYVDHLAAVKAIAWSPHHHGLLASGGGTADRCIRFWNTLTGQPMQCVDTGT